MAALTVLTGSELNVVALSCVLRNFVNSVRTVGTTKRLEGTSKPHQPYPVNPQDNVAISMPSSMQEILSRPTEVVRRLRILFVCDGNTCRSPMAEGLARKMLGNLVEAESAGVKAENGNPATKEAIQIMRSRFGVDLSKHRSRNLGALTSLEDFDHIVPMEDRIAHSLRKTYPRISRKLMKSWNVGDPINNGLEEYERSANQIQKRIEELSVYLRIKSA